MKVSEAERRICVIRQMQESLTIRMQSEKEDFWRDCDRLCIELLGEYSDMLKIKIDQAELA